MHNNNNNNNNNICCVQLFFRNWKQYLAVNNFLLLFIYHAYRLGTLSSYPHINKCLIVFFFLLLTIILTGVKVRRYIMRLIELIKQQQSLIALCSTAEGRVELNWPTSGRNTNDLGHTRLTIYKANEFRLLENRWLAQVKRNSRKVII